jgi:hypothetical protein
MLATPYLSKLAPLSLHALSPRQVVHHALSPRSTTFTIFSPLPLSSFSFLTPYPLFSPLCSLGVHQRERSTSRPSSRSAYVPRCHRSPLHLLLLEAAARGRRRRLRQGKSRSKKEKSPSGLSSKSAVGNAGPWRGGGVACLCRGRTAVALTLLLFSNLSPVSSLPLLFSFSFSCTGVALHMVVACGTRGGGQRRGTERGGGLWRSSALTHELLHDDSSSTAWWTVAMVTATR